MDIIIVKIIMIGFIVLWSAIAIWLCYKFWIVSGMCFNEHIEDRGVNDDDKAVHNTLDLINKSQKDIRIYDDGEVDSIYDNSEIINALKEKLSDKNYQIIAFFNFKDIKKTSFYKTFEAEDYTKQVHINIRPEGEDRPNDIHYKIVDDGKRALLSNHKEKATDRKYVIVKRLGFKLGAEIHPQVQRLLAESKKRFDALDMAA